MYRCMKYDAASESCVEGLDVECDVWCIKGGKGVIGRERYL